MQEHECLPDRHYAYQDSSEFNDMNEEMEHGEFDLASQSNLLHLPAMILTTVPNQTQVHAHLIYSPGRSPPSKKRKATPAHHAQADTLYILRQGLQNIAVSARAEATLAP